MSRIYLDNAATSFPKPPEVAEAVFDYMTGSGSSINRGCYSTAYQVEEMVYETRLLLCNLFGGHDPAEVVFTKNVTESLNILMKGLLKPGDHVLVSAMEHNAVMRPLRQLEKKGVNFTRIPCGHDGRLLTPSSMSGDSHRTQSHSSGSMHDGSHGTQSPSSVSVLAEDNDDLLLPSSSMSDDI
ncbi:MAG: aminotransferase class V-fold PLP-dependent enzyme, partial [Lachnospiraceae bacterium]|nr:aminotransferase class V-fold PLP-dependent enzyme [Lachnospiraceae bacterium]